MRCKYKADTSKYRQNTSNTSRIHPEAVSSVHQTDTYIPWALSITIRTETHQTQSKTPKGQLNALKLYHQHCMPTQPRACPSCSQKWEKCSIWRNLELLVTFDPLSTSYKYPHFDYGGALPTSMNYGDLSDGPLYVLTARGRGWRCTKIWVRNTCIFVCITRVFGSGSLGVLIHDLIHT